MFYYKNKNNFDTTLIPLHNLCCRNGTYYFRKMIKGKRYLLSLHTRDITEAYHLLFMKRYNMKGTTEKYIGTTAEYEAFQEWCITRAPQIKILKDLTQEEYENPYIRQHIERTIIEPSQKGISHKIRTAKHNIMEVWKKIPTTASQDVINTNTNRMQLMMKLLKPYDSIEDLDDNLDIIDDLKHKLSNTIQKSGKNKGQLYAPKTIKDTLKLLQQVADKAEENGWIDHFKSIKKKLVLKESEYNPDSKTSDRKIFSPEDLKLLFTSIQLLLNKNTDFMICFNKWDSTDATEGTNLGFSQYTTRIMNYPQAFAYTCLIALFLGIRANAIATIRHKDIVLNTVPVIDPKTQTTTTTIVPCIHFYIDKELQKAGDKREIVKHLKDRENKDFNRLVPIPKIIWEDLGFKNYLEHHKNEFVKLEDKRKYLKEWSAKHIHKTKTETPKAYERCSGDEYFIFEEVIKTGTGYRTKYINNTINKLLDLLKIKPNKNSKEMKDFHSFKTSFYSYNRSIPLDMLETIAGNSVSNKTISTEHYTDRDIHILYDYVNQIRFPYMELLKPQPEDNLE